MPPRALRACARRVQSRAGRDRRRRRQRHARRGLRSLSPGAARRSAGGSSSCRRFWRGSWRPTSAASSSPPWTGGLGGLTLSVAAALPETQHWHLLQQRRRSAPLLPLTADELSGELIKAAATPSALGVAAGTRSRRPRASRVPGRLSLGRAHMVVGSVCGGRLSDHAAAAQPEQASRRLAPSLLAACCAPAGCLVFGWAAGAGLALMLVGQALVGLGHVGLQPRLLHAARPQPWAALSSRHRCPSKPPWGSAASSRPWRPRTSSPY